LSIAAQFIVAKIWNKPKCLSTDEWVKKMWHIHAVDYYSAIKIIFSITGVDVGIILLSDISQAQKEKYHVSLICGMYKSLSPRSRE
jgi:hypothetical protein